MLWGRMRFGRGMAKEADARGLMVWVRTYLKGFRGGKSSKLAGKLENLARSLAGRR